MVKETNSKILKRVSKNFRYELKKLGNPALEKLSKKTKLSLQTLFSLKNNRAESASLSTLVELANLFKIKLVDFLK